MALTNDKLDDKKSIGSLHSEVNAGDIITSHKSVVSYWTGANLKRELCYNWRKGKHWDDEETNYMKEIGKAPIVLNKAITSIRSIMGSFLVNKYDVTPSPVEPSDQDLTDILKARYNHNHYHNNVKIKDKSLMEKSIIAGDAWQESYMIVTPGNKPRLIVQNQNDFAIYPDPNSIDLIDRRDCEFIDRDSWMTERDLCVLFPEKARLIKESLSNLMSKEGQSYTAENRFANREHENSTYKNGQYGVTERFYRVIKNQMWAVNDDFNKIGLGEDPDVNTIEEFKKDHEGYTIQKRPVEYLYLAIVCEQYSNAEFLFNGPYHCQPRNPIDNSIMFPLVQLICEDLGGDTNGLVEYQIGPNKLINATLSQQLYSIQHEVNTALLGNPDSFDEDGKQDIEQNHSHGNRVFWVKPGTTVEGAITQLPQTVNSGRNDNMIQWASKFQDEVSASNPSQQGLSEGQNVSGKLDAQRSESAYTQQIGITENYRYFLTKRARLWAFYDRKYFSEEETFRLIDKSKSKDPDWLTMNKPEKDQWGNIKKSNDINSAVYDYIFEDSIQSPHMRDKIRNQIVQLKQNSASNPDPIIDAYLNMFFLKMSDVDQELKDFIYEHNSVVQQDQQRIKQAQLEAQQAETKKAGGEMEISEIQKQGMKIDNDKKLQELAQAEAEQTVGFDEQIAQPIYQNALAMR